MKRIVYTLISILATLNLHAQSVDRAVEERLQSYFKEYHSPVIKIGTCKLDSFRIDHSQKQLDIYANPAFGYQLFRPETIQTIYRHISQLMPGPVNYFNIQLYTDGRKIQDLIPNALLTRKDRDDTRLWKKGHTRVSKTPWVTRASRPYEITHGLAGRHLTLWQSHGQHYKNKTNKWDIELYAQYNRGYHCSRDSIPME